MSNSGSFAELTTPEILRNLFTSAATGRLKVSSGHYRRTVYFDRGRPTYAVSSHPEESFGEVLVQAGRASTEQIRLALSKTPSMKKIGATLVEMGVIQPQDLLWAAAEQVRQIVLALFTLQDGTWIFEEGDFSGDDILRLPIKIDLLFREGVRRIADPRLLLRSLGSMEVQLEASANGNGKPQPTFALDERERGLLESIRRGPSTVRDLCRGSGMPAIDACRTLVTLVAAGAARRAHA